MKLVYCILNFLYARSFFLINSPFQFICFIEYINSKNSYYKKNDVIYIGYCSSSSKRQIKNINENIYKINLKIFYLDELFNIKVFHIILFILKNIKRKFLFCVSGTFKYYLFNEFIKKSKKTILLDEGFDNISILNNKKIIKIANYQLFSFFNYKNNFLYLKKFFQIKKNVNNELVYCLGTSMFNNDSIKLLEHLKNISNKFKGKKIIYFPHRSENLSFLKKENLNIKIINMPIELYLLKSKVLPKIVCGFYSTALICINFLFKDLYLKIYNINFNIDYIKIKGTHPDSCSYMQHILYRDYLTKQGIKNFYQL
jgi:hypothetical protein